MIYVPITIALNSCSLINCSPNCYITYKINSIVHYNNNPYPFIILPTLELTNKIENSEYSIVSNDLIGDESYCYVIGCIYSNNTILAYNITNHKSEFPRPYIINDDWFINNDVNCTLLSNKFKEFATKMKNYSDTPDVNIRGYFYHSFTMSLTFDYYEKIKVTSI